MKKTTKEYLGSLNNRRIISRKTVSPPPHEKIKIKQFPKRTSPQILLMAKKIPQVSLCKLAMWGEAGGGKVGQTALICRGGGGGLACKQIAISWVQTLHIAFCNSAEYYFPPMASTRQYTVLYTCTCTVYSTCTVYCTVYENVHSTCTVYCTVYEYVYSTLPSRRFCANFSELISKPRSTSMDQNSGLPVLGVKILLLYIPPLLV